MAKMITRTFRLPGNDKILKAAKKKLDTDTLKEELRGVGEEQFLAISVPVTR